LPAARPTTHFTFNERTPNDVFINTQACHTRYFRDSSVTSVAIYSKKFGAFV